MPSMPLAPAPKVYYGRKGIERMSTALYFEFRLGPKKALAGHVGWVPAEPFGLLRFQVLAFDHDGHLILFHASILNLGLEVAILPPDEAAEEDDALLGL